ncbi:MAG: hypothetical protein WC969_11255 [Elusimicrobiota bacterium]|jgi:hypothetical protein
MTTLLFSLMFAAAPVSAQTNAPAPSAEAAPAPAKSSLSQWFKNLKTALEKSAVEGRYRRVRTTAVAAVRGAGQETKKDEIYWKSGVSDKAKAQVLKERKEFEAAVALVLEGKLDEADAKLDAFVKDHPKSKFLPDVKEAKAKIAELRAAEAKK